jgi:hypothetical protein
MDRPEQKLQHLKALWERKRGEKLMPARAQFAIQELQPWFGNLALIDIPYHTVRLCGTNLISRFGRDATGCDITGLGDDVAASITSYIDCARATKSPSASMYNCIVEGVWMSFQELILPLSESPTEVTMILLGSYQIDKRPAWQLARQ